MDELKIIKTKPGHADFHLFENLPKRLYPADSIRQRQSETINKEFLKDCYVLLKNGEPEARAALYNNPFTCNELKTAALGNYESTADKEVSEKLLRFAIDEAKKSGAEFLIGPMNGSTWDSYRFSIHHDTSNFLLEPFHHLYYNGQFLFSGFLPISKYTSSIDKEIHFDHPEVLKLDKQFADAGVTIRNINMNDYEGELKKLYPFITEAFKTNFLYTPISWETFRSKYLEAAKIINPEYVLLAEDAECNVIGFIFCYDDLFNTNEKSLVIKTIARDKSKQWAGLGHVLANRVIRLVKSKGYKSIIHAFMIEQATSTAISKDFLGTVYKNYVLYGLKL